MTQKSVGYRPIDNPGAIALVTGAGSGIGKAITVDLVERGMRVIAAGRDMAKLEALRGELGEGILPFVLDVTDTSAISAFPGSLPSDWQEIEVLINNAGHDTGGRQAFQDGTAEDWVSIIETNVNGLMAVSRAIVPGMLERGHGHIINMGSVSGLYTYAGGTAYNASKFAVHGFTEALSKDFAASSIRVTEIMPGLVRTNFASNRLKGDQNAADAFYDAAADCLTPEDVAASVVFALEQPAHVTISQLVVEPTLTARAKA